ncbi:hypothetical protein HGB07_09065 [Candidatus Roizmanbacteria bacterium]|nr:hypothetical protein [Candidatus Roizmanbacteria bacterium]
MIEFIKKFSTYFGATLTSLVGLKIAFGIGFGWQLICFIVLLTVIVCAIIAWAEVYPKTGLKSSKLNAIGDEGSVSLSVKQALEQVKFATPFDESIAYEANTIVRRGLDKWCINYEEYKVWRQKNQSIFNAITSDQNQLIGFFDIFPLTEDAARGIIDGKLKERDLSVDSILPYNQNKYANRLYVASIMVNPTQNSFSSIVAKEIVLLKFIEFVSTSFPPSEERTLFAFAHTRSGEKLLKHAGFKNILLSKHNKQRDPLYELSPSGYAILKESFAGSTSKSKYPNNVVYQVNPGV